MKYFVVAVFIVYTIVISDASYELPKIDIPDLNEIPAGTLEKGEEAIFKRCREIGGDKAADIAKVAKDELVDCVSSLVNLTEVKEEIETAVPTGELDSVFKKYCKMSPRLRACVLNFTDEIDVCLKGPERKNKQVISDVTDSFINFVCHKEGDRIALFIAEGGPECLTENIENIQECGNATVQRHVPENVTLDSLNDLDVEKLENIDVPTFVIGERECREFDKMQTCVVEHLEKCKEPTPANIVNSMWNFIRKATPCDKYEVEGPSSASLYSHNTGIIVTVLVLLSLL